MEISSYDEIKVDRCANCGGLWFDTGELEVLRRDTWMADFILDRGDASTGKKFNRIDKIPCPKCEDQMEEEFDHDQPHIMYSSRPVVSGSCVCITALC